MAILTHADSSSTRPTRIAQTLRRALSGGHTQERRESPARSFSVHFTNSPSPSESRAPLSRASSSRLRPSLQRSSSLSLAPSSSPLLRRRQARRSYAGPPQTLCENSTDSPTPAVGSVTERNVVVVPGADAQALEMHAQVGVWEEQPQAPGWAAYEHAVASAGVWEHEQAIAPSVSKNADPFAPAAPSWIAHPAATDHMRRRELELDTLVSSHTAYITASMSDSGDSATLAPSSPAYSVPPQNKRMSMLSAAPSTRTRTKLVSRFQRAMRKLRGSSVPPS